ncbi:FAD-binding domain-containing protein [Mycena chlorophos]|uniref:FAD-binding domain-containing protein n=1 Tax=Mycena chlorophos TaxID=658473 RepID=A0A8H6TQX1_MYCCL|nr:FAD-binding domain-containing protein [Mycena chlorophos]
MSLSALGSLLLASVLLVGSTTASAAAASDPSLFPRRTSSSESSAQQACTHLQSALGPIASATGNAALYNFTVHNAWNLQNTLYQPTCIVFPRAAADVQTAMRAIYTAGSHYAVQAGSHSGMQGWNTIQDGVLISFSQMQNVSYDASRDSITFEPGIHWGNATAQLAQYGVAPVGGRVGDVGTGLLLGGGVSFLSPSYGFAADNFISVDVVLVDGRLVTATATNQYADLFRALKGGANRFGIVTRYEVRAAHVGTPEETPFYGGLVLYNATESANVALVKAVAKYVKEVTDPNASMVTTLTTAIVNGLPQQYTWSFLMYNGSSLPPSIFGDFLAIPALDSQIGALTWTRVLPVGDEPSPGAATNSLRGFTQHFGGSALHGDEELFLNAYTRYKNFTETFMSAESAPSSGLNLTTLWFTPVLASQIEQGRLNGGNSMLSGSQTTPYAMAMLAEQFNAGLQEIPASVQDGMDLWLEQVPRSEGLPIFVNECDAKQNAFASYGEYEFLKATYMKYDPGRYNVEHQQGPMGL